MDDKSADNRRAFGKYFTDAGEIVVYDMVVAPPWLMVVCAGRIVPLSQATERIAFQMLAEEVDSMVMITVWGYLENDWK